MVKNKNDKRKISNWENGDTFALKVNSKEYPKYNNRYIIFIKCEVDKKDWKTSRTTKHFRAKITKDEILPKSKEEIDKLEFIKTGWNGYIFEHYFYPEETKGLTSDKYMFIYQYILEINAAKYQVPQELIYLGNFDIKLPSNEYIPYSQFYGVLFSFWNYNWDYKWDVTDKLIECYQNYNLRKSSLFSKEFQDNYLEHQQKEIEIKIENDKRTKEVLEMYNKGLLTMFDNEKRTNNSLTYVGNEPEKKRK